ncbi:type II toxin-antitoxin system RelE/ParE family toxin [Calycomorphotria hydatis]|uniref:type II toxin-antitoxin system RelE/ParE family toxin n=1 Tax=Calycomorphotria hydatis TaxID=2528027 RepID=UPI0018D216C1|nr:type II toxin-antitoxin system RelE/ParE family toxin [Calycomorphotria hydatis]
MRWTSAARQDLVDTLRYLAKENEQAARNFVNRLELKESIYTHQPDMGSFFPGLTDEIRYFVVSGYVVLYVTENDGIAIIRLVHGSRDIASLLS